MALILIGVRTKTKARGNKLEVLLFTLSFLCIAVCGVSVFMEIFQKHVDNDLWRSPGIWIAMAGLSAFFGWMLFDTGLRRSRR